jgi:putative flippase GtrA
MLVSWAGANSGKSRHQIQVSSFAILSELAVFIAIVLGIGFNYVTIGRFAFPEQKSRSFLSFVISYTIIYFINVIALRGLLFAGFGPLLAQIILLPFIALCTFAILKAAVFAPGLHKLDIEENNATVRSSRD